MSNHHKNKLIKVVNKMRTIVTNTDLNKNNIWIKASNNEICFDILNKTLIKEYNKLFQLGEI